MLADVIIPCNAYAIALLDHRIGYPPFYAAHLNKKFVNCQHGSQLTMQPLHQLDRGTVLDYVLRAYEDPLTAIIPHKTDRVACLWLYLNSVLYTAPTGNASHYCLHISPSAKPMNLSMLSDASDVGNPCQCSTIALLEQWSGNTHMDLNKKFATQYSPCTTATTIYSLPDANNRASRRNYTMPCICHRLTRSSHRLSTILCRTP